MTHCFRPTFFEPAAYVCKQERQTKEVKKKMGGKEDSSKKKKTIGVYSVYYTIEMQCF